MTAKFSTRRRRCVPIANARLALLRHGFVQQIWPAVPGHHRQWILTWHNRHHLIRVILGPDRGHQTLILSHHDGTRWHADHEQRHRYPVTSDSSGPKR